MPDLRERLVRLIGPAIRHHDRVLCPDAKYLAGRIVDLILAGEDWRTREAVVQAAIRWHPVEATQDVLTPWRTIHTPPCGLCAGLLRLARLDAGMEEGR